MILVTFRHGLRATEVCQLRWDQYDLKRGTLHVNRIKNGIESVHPVGGEELRALRKLHREEVENRYVFVSERRGATNARGLSEDGEARRRRRQAAVLRAPAHAATCLRVQARQRWP